VFIEIPTAKPHTALHLLLRKRRISIIVEQRRKERRCFRDSLIQ
jgi:hypothetical protein